MPLAEWLLCQNLNPAKAVAIVLILSTDARFPKLFKRCAKFWIFLHQRKHAKPQPLRSTARPIRWQAKMSWRVVAA